MEQAEDELDVALARDRLGDDDGQRLTRTEVSTVFDRLRARRDA